MTNNWLKNNRYQINLLVPRDWKETLEQKAREKAFEEYRNVSIIALIRELIVKEYGLKIPE